MAATRTALTGEALQSALHPASGAAALMHDVTLVLCIGSTLILALVLALALFGTLSRPRAISPRAWVIGGGVLFPVVVLAALLAYALQVGHALSGGAKRPAEIVVTARLWWWEVSYPDAGAGTPAALANEIYVPVGRPVEIALRSDDVIHSFWVPALAGKVDMIPGRVNRLVLEAAVPGVFRGQCAEYCGLQHAWMAMQVVAVPEEDYRRWLAGQAAPAVEPATAFARRGREAFLREGCGGCHTIRGTAANGTLGPDLTHVGGRRMLAAGRLVNHAGTLAAWIADSQGLKPGNLMPSNANLQGEELRAVAAYLEGLR